MGGLEPGEHWGSVIAAYAATAAILGALVWYSLVEARRARRDLEALDARSAAKRKPETTP